MTPFFTVATPGVTVEMLPGAVPAVQPVSTTTKPEKSIAATLRMTMSSRSTIARSATSVPMRPTYIAPPLHPGTARKCHHHRPRYNAAQCHSIERVANGATGGPAAKRKPSRDCGPDTRVWRRFSWKSGHSGLRLAIHPREFALTSGTDTAPPIEGRYGQSTADQRETDYGKRRDAAHRHAGAPAVHAGTGRRPRPDAKPSPGVAQPRFHRPRRGWVFPDRQRQPPRDVYQWDAGHDDAPAQRRPHHPGHQPGHAAVRGDRGGYFDAVAAEEPFAERVGVGPGDAVAVFEGGPEPEPAGRAGGCALHHAGLCDPADQRGAGVCFSGRKSGGF